MIRVLSFILTLFAITANINRLNAQSDFSASNRKGCAPLTVQFSDLSSGSIVAWSWDFGNGNLSNLKNPSASYTLPGKYTVKLTVTDAAGNKFSATKTQFIVAFKSPVADFSGSPRTICQGESVSFSDQSTKGDTTITKYTWDMNDGTVITGSSKPTHVFKSAGTFPISYSVQDANGCISKVNKPAYILVNPKPTADFVTDFPIDCRAPSSVTFTDISKGKSLSGKWSFGDGNQKKLTAGGSIVHQYSNLGKYDVKLVVRDTNGCMDSVIRIAAVILEPFKADFTSDKQIFCGSGTVNFTNKSAPQTGVISSWDFGDGTTSTRSHPTKFYSKPGKYSVTLTIQSTYRNCSASITKNKYIIVNPSPKGNIQLSDTSPCKVPFTVYATYLDSFGYKNITWRVSLDNDKNRILGSSNPIRIDGSNHGKYLISAVVENKEGCIDTIEFRYLEPVMVSLKVEGVKWGCAPLKAELVANIKSNRNIKTILWEFHDGDIRNGLEAEKTFTDTGVFNAKITVCTNNNCCYTRLFQIHVGMKVKPAFYTLPVGDFCNNTDSILFINATQHPGFVIDSFIWNFDETDGIQRTPFTPPWMISNKPYAKTNIWHRYDRDTGWVNPSLYAYHHGCESMISQRDSIRIKAAFAKIGYFIDMCDSNALYLFNQSSAFTRFEWIIDKKKYTTDTVSLSATDPHYIRLRIWDDSTGCYDTSQFLYKPDSYASPSIQELGSNLCEPGYVRLRVVNGPKDYEWLVNGKVFAKNRTTVEIPFDTAGVYFIEYRSPFGKFCNGLHVLKYEVGETDLRGSLKRSPGCLPISLELYDSSYSTTKKHVWVLSTGDTIPITSALTKYIVKNANADTIWAVLKSKATKQSCYPTARLPISIAGPIFTLRQLWEHSCGMSLFQGFAVQVNKTPVNLNWDMGDGKQYSTPFVRHGYKDSGTYKIKVTMRDTSGCISEETRDVYFPGRRLKLRVAYTVIGSKCAPLLVQFRDSSSSFNVKITSWNWDFGDGTSSVLKNPQHQYLKPGKYSITLTIKDSLGCTETRKFLDLILVPGPDGQFTFSPKSDCMPLTVNFKHTTTGAIMKKEWDMGDGVVQTGNVTSYTYKFPGKYIPSLILKDSFGCTKAIQSPDTIEVFGLPKIEIQQVGLCLNDSVVLSTIPMLNSPTIDNVTWLIEGKRYAGMSVKVKFVNKNGLVKVWAQSKQGCVDSLTQNIRLFGSAIKVQPYDSIVCLGSRWKGEATFISDTAIVKQGWYLNNSYQTNALNFQFVPATSRIYYLQFKTVNVLGCQDSLNLPIKVLVGDTVTPQAPSWRRVSVTGDKSHELVWGQHNSFDFKRYRVWVDRGAGYQWLMDKSSLKDTMGLVMDAQSLVRSDCYKISMENLCGFTQAMVDLKSHCTIELKGKPLVNASELRWSAYVGWPVDSYTIYRQKNASTWDSIGRTIGSNLTFIDTNITCYETHVYQVKAHEFNGFREFSFSDTCHVKPIYINTVNPPNLRRATVMNDDYVRIDWEKPTKNRSPLVNYVVKGEQLIMPQGNPSSASIWNLPASKDSLVLQHEQVNVDRWSYRYKVLGIDACGDSSEWTAIAQSILLTTSLNNDYNPVLKWNKYQKWQDGVREYLVERNLGDGFKVIATLSASDTIYTDALSSLNCIPALEYRVTANRNRLIPTDSIWMHLSASNVSQPSTVTKVFVPNAFTPNSNRLNETFQPEGIFIASYSLKIFNIWGEMLFSEQGCAPKWDGNYMGKQSPQGVYAYLIIAKGIDGKQYYFNGNVTLLR
jgi:gliding motility-associated-like protein